MKLFKIVATTALLAVSAVQASAQSALSDILSSGTLKVGTTGDWNPMSMRDITTNGYTGYDIDVMTQLATDLGVEVEFVPTDWKTLVSGVTSGQYHITGSASVSPHKKRRSKSAFPMPYTASSKHLHVISKKSWQGARMQTSHPTSMPINWWHNMTN